MNNKNNIAVGLDIGTTKIVALVGRKNENGKIEILGYGHAKSLGVQRGVVNNITQTINSIKEAIEKAEQSAGIKIEEVTVGIAGQHIRSLQQREYITRPNSEDVINEEDLKMLTNQVYNLVMLPGEEIIHALPQEFKVDNEGNIVEPIGMYGSRLEANFHVVVGQISSIKNIARCVKAAGLKLVGLTLEPIASSSAVLSTEEKEAGVALIDIGGGTTDIAIFKDNIIRHTSVIPFGGNVITDDIRVGCSIIGKQAELLKQKFGSAWPDENKETEIVSIPGLKGREPKEITLKKLSQIIRARVEEILEQVYLELKSYGCEEQYKKLIAGIVLTGGGSKMKHIVQLTQYVTGMDVRIGFSNEHIGENKFNEIYGPEYATSVGLLMKGIEELENYNRSDLYKKPVLNNLNVVSTEVKESLEEESLDAIEKKLQEKQQEKDELLGEELGELNKSNSQKGKKFGIFRRWMENFIQTINETE